MIIYELSNLDYIMIFLTHFGIPIIIALILFTKNKKVILQSFYAFVSAYAVKLLINLLYYTPRPFVNDNTIQLLISYESSSSFPSGHTLTAFALATILYYYNKKLGICALIIALLVGISRVYLRVHYPIDIVGGIVVGVLSVIIINRLIKIK